MEDAWINALLGGVLSGAAVSAYLIGTGRILGIGGMLVNSLAPRRSEGRGTSASFLAGLVLVPAVVVVAAGAPAGDFPTNPLLLALAGLLVGVASPFPKSLIWSL